MNDPAPFARSTYTGSIRQLLQLMLVVIFVPMTLLLIYTGYRSYQLALQQAEQQALSLAQITADHVEGMVREGDALLKILASRPGIRDKVEGRPCDPVFAEALTINPQFANFSQIDLLGNVVCSSVPLPPGRTVDVRATPWFPRMLREQRFLVSEPFVGRVTKRQVASMAAPVWDVHGKMVGAIQLPLDLVKFRLLGRDKIPRSTILTVLDETGVVVARSQDAEGFVGRNLLSISEIARIVVEQRRGAVRARSSQGIERIYGFVPIEGTRWYALAGVDGEAVLGGVRRAAIETALVGLVVLMLMLGVALYLQHQITEPIGALQRVTSEVAQGKSDVRAQVGGPAELHAVAVQFNAMLDALNLQVRRLANSEAELRGLFAGSLEGILSVTESGHVLSANPAACVMLRRAATQLQGMRLADVLGSCAVDGQLWFAELLSEGEIRVDLLVSRPSADPLPMDVSAFVQTTADGNRTVHVFLRDMTDHQKQTELLAAKEAADIASRAKSAFLARMSHELRTPLNAILGFAQLVDLMPALQSQPKVLEMNRFIREAGEHLLALVEDVLDLSRIESGQMALSMERVNLQEVSHACQTLTESLAHQHGVTLRMAPAGAPVHACADATRVRQVLLNILSNAIKYNRPGGTVDIVVGAEDEWAWVRVHDSGIGMSATQLAQLYQPFNRLGVEQKHTVEGTGLGLVVARQLVEAMHGEIQVDSLVGSGTTFTVKLPIDGRGSASSSERPAA